MAGEYPSYYSTQLPIGNAATSAEIVSFGFPAKVLRLENYETVDIYVNLKGSLASTIDLYLRSCGGKAELGNLPVPVGAISAYTTSTGAANKLLRVLALG